MSKIDQLTQILYEVSMTIGSSLNLERMLRDTAFVVLRKLNNTALVIFERQQNNDQYHFECVFTSPHGFAKSRDYAALEKVLPESFNLKESESFYEKLPINVALDGDRCFHLMALPGYGLIALFRGYGFLPDNVIYSMAPLNKKLAVACQACLSHERLEEQVEARTRELEAKNKELEQFTYSVSHDLKAPLRGIDGYGQLLENEYADKLDEDGFLFLKNIRTATAQMNQLIEDLLTYSRMERRDLCFMPVDILMLFDQLLLERKHDIETRAIQVKINLDMPVKEFACDRDSIRQVFGNLVDNAIKFSQESKDPFIEINGSETETAWKICVKDNGIGFDAKYQERIFSIFQRLHLSEDYPGTGIGLAMVKKAVERMNGRVWAESEPGKGALFCVEIPKSQEKSQNQ